jgi:hypothetical protein
LSIKLSIVVPPDVFLSTCVLARPAAQSNALLFYAVHCSALLRSASYCSSPQRIALLFSAVHGTALLRSALFGKPSVFLIAGFALSKYKLTNLTASSQFVFLYFGTAHAFPYIIPQSADFARFF